MDRFFNNFYNYEGFGPAIQSQPASQEAIEKYKGKLPDKLLEYWELYGWCGYANGLFWTVNPEEWDDALEAWIGDTELMEVDAYHIIARSAFGELFLWGERTGNSVRINSPWGMIFPRFNQERFNKIGPDRSAQLFFASNDREHLDLNDVNDKPLFQRALKKLGPLDHDTMYGFVPALAMTGEPKLEDLQILDAHVHLEILAQMTPKQIMADICKLARETE